MYTYTYTYIVRMIVMIIVMRLNNTNHDYYHYFITYIHIHQMSVPTSGMMMAMVSPILGHGWLNRNQLTVVCGDCRN